MTLQLGAIEDLDIWDRYTTTQNESLAVAQVRWMIDNRYDSYFLNPESNTSVMQYSFQNVIWEIMADGGTAAGLDFATGDIDRTIYSDTSYYGSSLWTNMNQLLSDVKNSGVTESYVGTTRIYAALDTRAGYQDYLFLANGVDTVPEPSGVALLGLGGIAMLLRRRR
ncbi:MAG: PEP-CTERM sorting domain-containing protein [Akkermansiaceae bacterium]|nr:PEP-CTERM sorting domain-containing protein [Akkermansiaceae bacterium]